MRIRDWSSDVCSSDLVITGDVGAGKTTLVGHLMNTIDSGRLTAVKLVSTQVEGDDLLRLVAEQFGIEWEGESKAELLRSRDQYLREQARAGKRTLLLDAAGQKLAIPEPAGRRQRSRKAEGRVG